MGFINRARGMLAAALAVIGLGGARAPKGKGPSQPGVALPREKPRGGLVQGTPKVRNGWGPGIPGSAARKRVRRAAEKRERLKTRPQRIRDGIARRRRAGADKSLRQEIKRMLGSPRKARRAMLAERRGLAAALQGET